MPGKFLIDVTDPRFLIDENRIFAIAYGQRALAFGLTFDVHAVAIAEGGVQAPEIGAEWMGFAPWSGKSQPDWHERLMRWCRRAFDEASADEPSA